jgi:AraC family transcriptional regulator, transcriptional activator of pobA
LISFSLESLGKMNLLPEKEAHSYGGFFFVKIDSDFNKKIGIFRYPCRINAYIAMLCVEGSFEMVSNLKRYKIEKDCLFISMPKDIIQLCEWSGGQLYVVAIDDDSVGKANLNFNNFLSVFIGIQSHPCIRIQTTEAVSLQDTFSSLQRDLEEFKGKEFNNEIVISYINLITYKAFSFINRYLETQSEELELVNKRNKEYYNRFMTLLNQYSVQERTIGFYASKLYITPKYMTSLIKKTSGRSAMEWINDYVILEAKNLLRYSEMSIQEISEYLNFSNQSFFAQYFKRLTGFSPSVYRENPQ